MIKSSNEITIFKVLFKNYYRKLNYIDISSIENREFAFQFFDREGMIRHVSFKSIEELLKYLVNNVPAHVYYSSAYYKYPDNLDMDGKVWLGADLIFDIDADHLNTKNCMESKLLTLECLNDAFEELQKLIDILLQDFGFNINDVKIVFSGHRGFHVHVENDIVRRLTQEERREIVDYLLARGFNINFIIKNNKLLINLKSPGYGGRIAKIIYEIYSKYENNIIKKILEEDKRIKLKKSIIDSLTSLIPTITEKLKVNIDEIVTMDIKRLIRLPNSLHGKTGLIVLPIDKNMLNKDVSYVIEKAIAFKKGYLKVQFIKRLNVRNVLGEKLPNYDVGTIVKLPTHIALYLISQKYCEIHE